MGEAFSKDGSIACAASKSSSFLVPEDASLSEGLQLVIMHHISKVDRTSAESLIADENLLFDCHLSRITHYAQKLVNSLLIGTSVSGASGSDTNTGTNTRAGTDTI